MELESIIKLIIVLVVLFAPYVLINSISAIVFYTIKGAYPAYRAVKDANEKARQELENIK